MDELLPPGGFYLAVDSSGQLKAAFGRPSASHTCGTSGNAMADKPAAACLSDLNLNKPYLAVLEWSAAADEEAGPRSHGW
jgi:hypothetical protein